LPENLVDRFTYTGFLRREVPHHPTKPGLDLPERYILVMAGGGGDGGPLMRSVIRARSVAPGKHLPFVLVLGPFMSTDERQEIHSLAASDPDIHIFDFVNQPETLVSGAAAVVGMAGYNTFCEIISFDKPAMLVPRILPRREQFIRANRATELGLIDMLLPSEAEDKRVMSARLLALPDRNRPQQAGAATMLDGLQNIRNSVMNFDVVANRIGVFFPPAAE